MLESNLKIYSVIYTIQRFPNTNLEEKYDYVVAYNEEEVKKAIYNTVSVFEKIIGSLEIEEIKVTNGLII